MADRMYTGLKAEIISFEAGDILTDKVGYSGCDVSSLENFTQRFAEQHPEINWEYYNGCYYTEQNGMSTLILNWATYGKRQ